MENDLLCDQFVAQRLERVLVVSPLKMGRDVFVGDEGREQQIQFAT